MKYDFNLFMERCVDLCKLYLKTGDYRQEEAAEIRNSIAGCHKYFEQNLRGVFEKIVIDCWIEFLCRQNEIGVITLWNNYIPCKNEFEKAVFMRLSEYRHGYAINQWVNILKVQEYANIKVDFIFGGKLKSTAAAAARANYFDLMFNVVANELGFDLNSIADNRVYTMGRTPNSPFIMSSVSREIVRNLLTDLKYNDNQVKNKKNDIFSDQIAMDAFSAMKSFLPQQGDNIVETIIKSLSEIPMKVYMPASLKAAVDLEVDAIIEHNAFLQKCELCKDYYMRSEEYNSEYCSSVSKSGKTCYEIMAGKKGGMKTKKTDNIESIDAALFNERCERLYKEMSARINAGFTQRDFSDWCRYLTAIRDNILNGQASIKDFDNFAEYSRSMTFLPTAADESKKSTGIKDEKGRAVKPFVFERVDRREIAAKPAVKYERYEEDEEEEERPVREVPVISRVSSKVIRGVTPETYASGGVTIPYGMPDNLQYDRREEVKEAKAVPVSSPPLPPSEEDVKIYSGKTQEPPKPEEFVKVFNPNKKAPPKIEEISARNEQPIRDNRPTQIKKAPVNIAPKLIREENKPRVPAFSPAPALSIGNIKPKPEKYIDENINTGHVQERMPNIPERIERIPERIERMPERVAKEEPVRKTPLTQIYASQKNEETQEIGFAEMLRNFERRDGFSDDKIPTDADGVPVSHKTKRVMDAIFKQSKPSLFVNINKGEE
jgi:hypothetical protein